MWIEFYYIRIYIFNKSERLSALETVTTNYDTTYKVHDEIPTNQSGGNYNINQSC